MRILSILFTCCNFFFIIFCILIFILYIYKVIDGDTLFVICFVLFYVFISLISWYYAFYNFNKDDPSVLNGFDLYLIKDINYIVFIIKKYLFSLFSNYYFLFINFNLLAIVVLIYIFKMF